MPKRPDKSKWDVRQVYSYPKSAKRVICSINRRSAVQEILYSGLPVDGCILMSRLFVPGKHTEKRRL
jgi:hypothetical protein